MAPLNYLTDYLPRAGMIWPSGRDLLTRQQKDHHVFAALRKHGIIGADGSQTVNKNAVDAAVANLLVIAREPPVLGMLRMGTLNFLLAVRSRLPWAGELTETVFAEFFGAVLHARRMWKENPREPFNPAEHCQIAREAEAFLTVAPGECISMKGYAVELGLAFETGLEDEDLDAQLEEMEMEMPDLRASLRRDVVNQPGNYVDDNGDGDVEMGGT